MTDTGKGADMDSVTTKVCTKCGQELPLSSFYFTKEGKPRGAQCRKCALARVTAWAKQNPERSKQIKSRWNIANSETVRERSRQWRMANAEKSRQIKRDWNERNREQVRRINQNYYQSNKAKVSASARMWREANPDKWAAIQRLNKMRRAARLASAKTFHVTQKDLSRILRGPCAVAGCEMHDLTVDHIVPLSRGGSHGVGNLQPLCSYHNSSKNKRTWMEFKLYLRRVSES